MRTLHGLLFALAVPAALAQASAGNDEVYRYRGADRDARLVEKAKQEGTVVLYTSLAPTESKPLAAAFERKYGLKVELWRAPSDNGGQRGGCEAGGSSFTVGGGETTRPAVEMPSGRRAVAAVPSSRISQLAR